MGAPDAHRYRAGMMDLDYRAALQREVALFVRASRTDLTAQVVHCPEWTVADLTWHMCGVLRFWRAIGTGEITSPADEARVDYERVPDDELAALLEHEAAEITNTVYDIEPATPVWSWSAQKDVGFVQRRMAQESAVHRWDAELAVGAPNPIDADLAVDGVDEFLTLFLPAEEESLAGPIDRVRLETTDRDAGWTVSIGDGRCAVGDGEADAVARAAASDLLLLLWTRREASTVAVEGDESVLARFLARSDLT